VIKAGHPLLGSRRESQESDAEMTVLSGANDEIIRLASN
jgi:hypothetical protein